MLIPKYFHFFYSNNNINNDIEDYIFISIKSFIEINNPDRVYFHYFNLPNGNLMNKIKNNLILKKILIPKKYENNSIFYFEKYKKILIYKNLIEYGGIYLDNNSISINPFTNLFKYNFFKSKNDEIIGCEKDSYMANKYFSYYYDNTEFKENFGKMAINDNIINNYLLSDLKYNTDNDYLNNIITKEINDYSFGNYFHLINNCYFINFYNNENLKKVIIKNIFHSTTIYSLLLRNSLVYNLLNNVSEINIDNTNLINNIDYIYWINLEDSTIRRKNMNNLLKNFNIENIRINAVNGSIENNISKKYFYNLDGDNNYPDYSNKEYAILLSHLNTIEKYINENILKYGVALICEDDLSLDFINYWNKDIKSIIENAPFDWDIIMLGYFSVNLNYNELYSKWNNEWSAISYLVNHKNMKNKVINFKKDGKWICKKSDLMVSDNYIFSNFNTYVYKYPYFTFPNDNDSTFHEDHLNYHKIYKICNLITLEHTIDSYN
jgi:hypothetical protein